MKKLLALLILCSCGYAHADSIRTPDGYSCSFDPDSNAYELSLSGNIADSNDDNTYFNHMSDYYSDRDQNSIGVNFTWKFGRPKQLDCNKLFRLAVHEKEAQVKLLKKKLEVLNASENVNWDDATK